MEENIDEGERGCNEASPGRAGDVCVACVSVCRVRVRI